MMQPSTAAQPSLRVPAGLDICLLATSGCSSPCSALARLAALNNDSSVVSDYNLLSAAAGPSRLALAGMMFKAMDHARHAPRVLPAKPAADQGLYSLQWSAVSTASPPMRLLPDHSTGLRLSSGGQTIPLPAHASAAAAAALSILQQSPAGSQSMSLSAYCSSAGMAGHHDHADRSTAAAAACTGLLRVAARELTSTSISTLLNSSLAAHKPGLPPASQPDAFGHATAAGTWQVPALLPSASQAARQVTISLSSSLIMGGTGDIGSLIGLYACSSAAPALHLSSSPTQVLLAGRSGRAALPWLDQLPPSAQLTAVRCDGSSAEEVHALGAQLQAQPPAAGPVKAILQAGGVVQDAALSKQTAASLRAVLAPKAGAARHLAAAQWALPVANSVAFSSMSALLGTPGQANYAAANAVLDAGAEHAQAQGEHSLPWHRLRIV